MLENTLRRVLRLMFGSGADVGATNPIPVLLTGAVGSSHGLCYYGVVTAVPGANQFTIPTLAGMGAGKFTGINPYHAFVLRDAAGGGAAPQGTHQPINGYTTATGVFQTTAFGIAVDVGDEILIIHPSLANQLTETPISGSIAGNWNSGAGTSGEVGADLLTFGGAATQWEILRLIIDISNLTPGANITVKMFNVLTGSCCFRRVYTQGTDPDELWIIEIAHIWNPLRIEIQSDQAADDGLATGWEYWLRSI